MSCLVLQKGICVRFRVTLPVSLSIGLLVSSILAGCPVTPSSATGKVVDSPRVAVFNGLGKTIDLIDPVSRQVESSVLPTGKYPNQFVEDGSRTLLVVSGDSQIRTIDLRAKREVGIFNLPEGFSPQWLVPIAPGRGVVAGYGSGLAWVNWQSGTLEATSSVPLGTAFRVAISNGKAYVPVSSIEYNPDYSIKGYVYAGVHVYDVQTRALLRTLDLAKDADPQAIATGPDGIIWVGTQTELLKIDPAEDTLSARLTVGKPISFFAFRDRTGYAVLQAGGLLDFDVDKATWNRGPDKVMAGGGAGLLIRGNEAWTSDFGNDQVLVTDLTTGLASGSPIPVGDGPQHLIGI